MLLRVFLAIAIVAALAAGALSFIVVKEKAEALIANRDAEKTAKEQAQTELSSTKGTLKKTEDTLSTTSNRLVTSEANLKTATANIAGLDKRITDLTTEMERVKGERDSSLAELSAWKGLDLPVERVRGIIVDVKKLREEREVLEEERRLLTQNNVKLQAKLAALIGKNEDTPPALPPGLKGKVVAVDPKWEFVVLDIGGNQGVLERGEMLVNRAGKLVAKVKVVTVEPDRSVANILPSYKVGDVLEGDEVIH